MERFLEQAPERMKIKDTKMVFFLLRLPFGFMVISTLRVIFIGVAI
jgi:hypothetical protein